jgi:hypothetical protein
MTGSRNVLAHSGVASDLTKEIIYTQIMVPLKVYTLSNKIASAYLQVSDQHLVIAMSSIDHMRMLPKMSGSTPPEERERLVGQMRQMQSQLENSVTRSTGQVMDLVQGDRKQFVTQITDRTQALSSKLERLLPSITQPGKFSSSSPPS